MWDNKKPTVQLLGRYQPWHEGHTALFKRAHARTGQVCIMVRNTFGTDEKNPFDFSTVSENINHALLKAGFILGHDYIILTVPNIVDITYGRDVGYTITKETLDAETEAISATKKRLQLK